MADKDQGGPKPTEPVLKFAPKPAPKHVSDSSTITKDDRDRFKRILDAFKATYVNNEINFKKIKDSAGAQRGVLSLEMRPNNMPPLQIIVKNRTMYDKQHKEIIEKAMVITEVSTDTSPYFSPSRKGSTSSSESSAKTSPTKGTYATIPHETETWASIFYSSTGKDALFTKSPSKPTVSEAKIRKALVLILPYCLGEVSVYIFGKNIEARTNEITQSLWAGKISGSQIKAWIDAMWANDVYNIDIDGKDAQLADFNVYEDVPLPDLEFDAEFLPTLRKLAGMVSSSVYRGQYIGVLLTKAKEETKEPKAYEEIEDTSNSSEDEDEHYDSAKESEDEHTEKDREIKKLQDRLNVLIGDIRKKNEKLVELTKENELLKKNKNLSSDRKPLNDKIAELQEKIESIKWANESLEKQLADSKTSVAALSDALGKTSKEKDDLAEDKKSLVENLKKLNGELNALRVSKVSNDEDLKIVTNLQDELRNEKENVLKKTKELEETKSALDKQISDLKEKNSALEKQISDLTEENSSLDSENDELAKEKEQLGLENKTIKGDIKNLKEKLAEKEKEITGYKTVLEERRKTILARDSEIQGLKSGKNEPSKEVQRLQDENAKLIQQNSELNSENDTLSLKVQKAREAEGEAQKNITKLNGTIEYLRSELLDKKGILYTASSPSHDTEEHGSASVVSSSPLHIGSSSPKSSSSSATKTTSDTGKTSTAVTTSSKTAPSETILTNPAKSPIHPPDTTGSNVVATNPKSPAKKPPANPPPKPPLDSPSNPQKEDITHEKDEDEEDEDDEGVKDNSGQKSKGNDLIDIGEPIPTGTSNPSVVFKEQFSNPATLRDIVSDIIDALSLIDPSRMLDGNGYTKRKDDPVYQRARGLAAYFIKKKYSDKDKNWVSLITADGPGNKGNVAKSIPNNPLFGFIDGLRIFADKELKTSLGGKHPSQTNKPINRFLGVEPSAKAYGKDNIHGIFIYLFPGMVFTGIIKSEIADPSNPDYKKVYDIVAQMTLSDLRKSTQDFLTGKNTSIYTGKDGKTIVQRALARKEKQDKELSDSESEDEPSEDELSEEEREAIKKEINTEFDHLRISLQKADERGASHTSNKIRELLLKLGSLNGFEEKIKETIQLVVNSTVQNKYEINQNLVIAENVNGKDIEDKIKAELGALKDHIKNNDGSKAMDASKKLAEWMKQLFDEKFNGPEEFEDKIKETIDLVAKSNIGDEQKQEIMKTLQNI